MPVSDQSDATRVAAVTMWFAQHSRALPWRDSDRSRWGVLVSEVMLQQTPVSRVEPVWRQWMERWPDPVDLAQASQADAVRAWGRLGYPRRAQRLWECARVVVGQFGGTVPCGSADLLSLPGVGTYTAAAVRSFACGQRDVVLDTNVRRVIARAWSGVAQPGPHVRRDEWERANGIVPLDPATATAWNAGAMELGALVCTARAPACEECPLAPGCVWLAQGRQGLDSGTRRGQAWHGTDRQVRGRILAVLRESSRPVQIAGHADLADVEPGQLDRCVESLLVDRLVAETPRPGWLSLDVT